MEEQKKSSSGVLWGVIVLIIAVASFGTWKYMKKDSSAVVTPTDNTVVPPTTPTEVTTSYLYKDGEYTANGNYTSPGGAEQVGVKLTLKNDVITDAVVTSLATRPESKMMQGKFISGFKALVVGKKLSEVSLDKVSGSSLTPKGFNDAVAQIKTQAKV